LPTRWWVVAVMRRATTRSKRS